jgi:hypothetical protein
VERLSHATWLWPALIILLSIGVELVTFVFPAVVIRPLLVMCFLFVCPGMTVVRFFGLSGAVIEWMLALALGLAIDSFVAGIFLYAGWWSPEGILAVLIGLCLIGASIQLVVKLPAFAALKMRLGRVWPAGRDESASTPDKYSE